MWISYNMFVCSLLKDTWTLSSFRYSVRLGSVPQSCPTLCNPMDCSMPGLPVHHQLPEFTQIHVHWVGDAIQPSHPLSTPSPPTFNLSQHQGLFKWVSSAYQVAKVLELQFSFSINPSNEYSGLISFRIDWLDVLAVRGILKSLLQHHCSKASILRCSALFIVQLSHPYMATGKTKAWTRHTFVSTFVRYYKCEHLCCCSVTQSWLTLCDPMDCSMPVLPCLSRSPRAYSNSLGQDETTVLSSVVAFSCCLQSRVFSSESTLWIRWPRYWSFSLSISPSNEYSGLISFRIDWFDLLAIQRTLKSLFQHHSSKASIFQCSDSFMVQLSHPYMTTGKTIALTIETFVSKVMSLLFNMFSSLP